jgi:hypothetical protein
VSFSAKKRKVPWFDRYTSEDELFHRPVVGKGKGVAVADRIDNQGRRYNALLLALRHHHPDWSADMIRRNALLLLRLDVPRREVTIK